LLRLFPAANIIQRFNPAQSRCDVIHYTRNYGDSAL